MRMKKILVAAALITTASYGMLPVNSMADSVKTRVEDVNVVSGGVLWGSAKFALVNGIDYVASSSAVHILSRLLGDHASFDAGTLNVSSLKAPATLSLPTRGLDSVKVNGAITLRFNSLTAAGATFIPLNAFQMTLADLGSLSGLQGSVLSIFPDLPSHMIRFFVSKAGILNVADARSFKGATGQYVEIIPYFQQNGTLHIATYSGTRLTDFATNATTYNFTVPIDWRGRHGIWIDGTTGSFQSDMTLLDITGQNATRLAFFEGTYSVSYYLVNGRLEVVTSDRAGQLTLSTGKVDTVLSNRLYEIAGNQATEQTQFKSGVPFAIGSFTADPAWQAFSIASEMIQFGSPVAMKKDLVSKFDTAPGFYRITRSQASQLTSFLGYPYPVLSLDLVSSVGDHRTYTILGGGQRLELTLQKVHSAWALSGLSVS